MEGGWSEVQHMYKMSEGGWRSAVLLWGGGLLEMVACGDAAVVIKAARGTKYRHSSDLTATPQLHSSQVFSALLSPLAPVNLHHVLFNVEKEGK